MRSRFSALSCVYKSIQNRNVVGPGQRSLFLVLTKRSAASGDENAACAHERVHAQNVRYFPQTKGPGKREHFVADTLLPMMFLGLRKLGNICCGHKMFLNKIRNIFCVPDTKFVSATNVARAGKRGNICVGNNVSATMCLRLPGP